MKLNNPDNKILQTALRLASLDHKSAEVGENFHIQGISIFEGDNEAFTTKITHISQEQNIIQSLECLNTPNRGRQLGGVVLYLASEQGEGMAITFLFHKGNVFTKTVNLGPTELAWSPTT